MPLIKSTSKQAFATNVKKEMAAGRPQDQAVAIAYATKREAQKMAHGTEHHSRHSQKRSDHYHRSVANTIEATAIGRGPTKMTRQEAVRGKNEEAWDR